MCHSSSNLVLFILHVAVDFIKFTDDRSLMWNKKKRGSNTQSCGTPETNSKDNSLQMVELSNYSELQNVVNSLLIEVAKVL